MKDMLIGLLKQRIASSSSKQEILSTVIFTTLSVLNIEPMIAMAALDKAITMVRDKKRKDKDREDMVELFI